MRKTQKHIQVLLAVIAVVLGVAAFAPQLPRPVSAAGGSSGPTNEVIDSTGISINSAVPNPADTSITITGSGTGSGSEVQCAQVNWNPDQGPPPITYTTIAQPIAFVSVGSTLSATGGQGESLNATITSVANNTYQKILCGSGELNQPGGAQLETFNFTYTINTSNYPNGTYTTTVYLGNSYYPTPCVDGTVGDITSICYPNSASATFTVKHSGGTINVNADRLASWYIASQSGSYSNPSPSQSATYPNAPASTYTMYDAATQSTFPYGFADSPTTTGFRNNSSWIFASIIKRAEASQCEINGWTCVLSAGGVVNYNLTTTTCTVIIQTSVNGNVVNMSLPLTYSGPLNSYSYSSAPQSPYSIADSSGSTFTLTVPSSGTWNGYASEYVGTDVSGSTTISYPSTTLSPNPVCSAGGNLTFTAKYMTRPALLVQ